MKNMMCEERAVAQVPKNGAKEAQQSRPASSLVSKLLNRGSKQEKISNKAWINFVIHSFSLFALLFLFEFFSGL
jgi:hypothetical protein